MKNNCMRFSVKTKTAFAKNANGSTGIYATFTLQNL